MIVKIRIDTEDKGFAKELIRLLGLEFVDFEEEKRTTQQNKALHLFFTILADELKDAGFDMYKTLNKALPLPWNCNRVKEFMWRPVQEHVKDKESTKQLTTKDIDVIYEIMMKIISERTGVYVPFPSEEELRMAQITYN
jgi:hypothetical protein